MDPERRLAESRARQRALYGAPIGEKVHRMVRALGLTQAQLAAAVGVSPAMLSQLVSGRRVKIGDPAVLARFRLLDARCADGPLPPERVPALLAEVRETGPTWAGPPPVLQPVPHPVPPPGAAVEPADVRPPSTPDPAARRTADAADALRA
ncbi:helix-turn-helix transcriptional regulator, partial [Pseudonocardia xishanensis]|uniref:helix-turn-helix domain-containing protein n=1 Tax=Pseudonocardia xishanensis TaxID=630995 RepID=UPI0031E60866